MICSQFPDNVYLWSVQISTQAGAGPTLQTHTRVSIHTSRWVGVFVCVCVSAKRMAMMQQSHKSQLNVTKQKIKNKTKPVYFIQAQRQKTEGRCYECNIHEPHLSYPKCTGHTDNPRSNTPQKPQRLHHEEHSEPHLPVYAVVLFQSRVAATLLFFRFC